MTLTTVTTVTTVKIHQAGSSDQLCVEQITIPAPSHDEVRIKQSRIGINFADIYFRKGLYPMPEMPATLGLEAIGVIKEAGKNITGFSAGDRVIYAGFPLGGYVTERNIPAQHVIKIPDDLSDKKVAGTFLRGLTACMLLTECLSPKASETVLIHAAAGGLGQILVRWAKHLGLKVIGTVGSTEKADLARALGADHTVLYKQEDFKKAVARLTNGEGVDYAIDGIGGDNLLKTIQSTKPFGVTMSIGQIAGNVAPIPPELLKNRFLIRPSILALLSDNDRYHRLANQWFDFARQSNFAAASEYNLSDVKQAHDDLEAGRSAGSIVLRTD
ncbi:alcohol dehydrogenase [Thalassospira sp. MCCC 1A02803]|nr:alcohol dehydrogenase [Thalassospira sp. MCCC 1A02803]